MITMAKKTAALLLATTAVVWAAAESKPIVHQLDGKEIELARYAKAFIGPGNIRIDVAPYKESIHQGAILVFHGVEGEWDGKALNHLVKPDGYQGLDYITTWNGKDWHTIVMRKDEEGKAHYNLYVPGVNEEISLVPSDGAAQLTTPAAILQDYEEQKNTK